MKKTYLIADTHFGDERIRKYENRPFPDTEQMDTEIIKRWNAEVSDNDMIYVLGDFGADGYESKILSQLNGVKFLVKGNHDTKSNSILASNK